IGFIVAYQLEDKLIPFLMAPLHGEKLVYLNPAGGFSFIFMISVYGGLALALPVLIQQLYSFVRPALPEAAQKKTGRILVASSLLLISGVAFGYYVAVPNALNFLYSIADQYIQASLTADSYLNFMIAYTIGIGIIFQLPLLLLLIHAIKPLKPGGLLKSEKWVVLIAFIIAAVITPTPDPVNQTIIAAPVIIVYQIGVVSILLNIAKKRRQAKRAAHQSEVITPAQPANQPRVKPVPHMPLETASAGIPVVPLTALHPQRTGRPIDGFTRVRRQVEHVTRQVSTPIQPVKKLPTVAPQPLRRTRGISIDGIVLQKRATSY
ncbi:MAG TPA: twin-arginine translocase subunit TatC, partial [Dongiaceae bacterium]|nr:twin-arginine translocase subunit TatC [Dongiaceae bacterium]